MPETADASPEHDEDEDWERPEEADQCAPPEMVSVPELLRPLDGLARHPTVAAFDAGRLCNGLRFHLTQAYLGPAGPHRKPAEGIFRALNLQALLLGLGEEKCEAVRNLVAESFERLKDRLDEECHHEDCYQLIDHLNEPAIGEPEEVLEDFLSPAFEVMGRIEDVFLAALGERDRRAYRLGKLVDQGIRRRDIHCHMLVQEVKMRSRQGESVRIKYMTTVERRPGEVPPDQGWHGEIEARAMRLGLLDALPPGSLHLQDREEVGDWITIVERLVEMIRALLANPLVDRGMAHSGQPVGEQPREPQTGPELGDRLAPVVNDPSAKFESGPRWGGGEHPRLLPEPLDPTSFGMAANRPSPHLEGGTTPERLVLDPETRTIILDGQVFQNIDGFAFRCFDKIYKAHARGNRIPARELGDGRVLRRLKRNLPSKLFAIIDRRGGKGCGCCLKLPQRNP
jgi:hypothetical protein